MPGRSSIWMEVARGNWDVSESLGTGGGVLQCLALCAEHALVVSGNCLTPVRLAPLIARVRNRDRALLGVNLQDAARHGTLTLDENGRLLKFAEKRPGAGIINAGLYLLSRSLLENFPRNRKLSMEEEILPSPDRPRP